MRSVARPLVGARFFFSDTNFVDDEQVKWVASKARAGAGGEYSAAS